jgi:histidyl-tRNA synthetase
VDEYSLNVSNRLRAQGISTCMNIGTTSFKSQLKKADKSGASFAIIIGDDEVKKKTVQIKLLRKEMDQQEVLFNNIVDFIKNNAL